MLGTWLARETATALANHVCSASTARTGTDHVSSVSVITVASEAPSPFRPHTTHLSNVHIDRCIS